MRKLNLIMAAAVFLAASAGAEETADPLPEAVASFNEAYSGWDGDGFRRAAEQLRAAGERMPESVPAHYWHGVARFHHALYLLDGEQSGKKVRRALDAAEDALERSLELDEESGEPYALLSAITGLRIGLNPLSGVWRGSRFQSRADRALELSPENPRVHYLLGTNYYHAPRRMGGKEKAREHFLKAETLFEKERAAEAGPLQPRWGYDACLAFLGDIYREEGDREKAREYFRRTLAVNPNHRPARENLRKLEPEKERDE